MKRVAELAGQRSRSERDPEDNEIRFPVIMAEGIRLFPYRTQKLSPHASKVLGWQRPGRIDHRRILIFLSSSMAEHSAVNRRVVSSSLT